MSKSLDNHIRIDAGNNAVHFYVKFVLKIKFQNKYFYHMNMAKMTEETIVKHRTFHIFNSSLEQYVQFDIKSDHAALSPALHSYIRYLKLVYNNLVVIRSYTRFLNVQSYAIILN